MIGLGANLPVFVFLDELDRCRPNYAVEMLESIKHFFDVPGFVFVVATDTEQISHAIKVIYGDGFDSEIYLRRFFNAKVLLPLPDVKAYTAIKYGARFSKSVNKREVCPRHIFSTSRIDLDAEVAGWLNLFAKAYQLQLRDIDQIFEKLLACALNFDDSNSSCVDRPLNIVTLLVLIIESNFGSIDHLILPDFTPGNLNIKNRFFINETTMIDDFVYKSISLSVKKKVPGEDFYRYPSYRSLENEISTEGRVGQMQYYTGLHSYAIARYNADSGFDCMEYKNLVNLACNLK